MFEQKYKRQVNLLLKVLPEVAKEEDFALHGGTAINLFIRDMPRLSVDIDLTYIPIESRDLSLKRIHLGLEAIKARLSRVVPEAKVEHKKDRGKLLIARDDSTIKLEVNLVGRGILGVPQRQQLSEKTANEYEALVSMQVVPLGQLYGGKICAALDRQHPRDIFDVKSLLGNEGLSREVMTGFLLALISNNRPVHEMLNPNLLEQRITMNNQFSGMTSDEVDFDYDTFESVRKKLVVTVNKQLLQEDKDFLLSMLYLSPNWDIHDFKRFPAVQWKLKNLKKLKDSNIQKYQYQCDLLKQHLASV